MPDQPLEHTRRTVLRGVVVAGGLAVTGGVLAACSGGDSSSTSATASSDTPTTEAPTTEAPTTDAPTTDAPTTDAPTTDAPTEDGPSTEPTTEAPPSGTSVGAASAIAVGSGKIFKSPKVVVTQPQEGTFKAFSSVCTHQGCPVSEIIENAIVCNCHGSEFSFTDGSVITGPASRPLEAKQVTESGGTLFVS